MTQLKIGLCVPTFNAGEEWREWLRAYSLQESRIDVSLVIDSSSNDATVVLAEKSGLNVYQIDKASFNHGATRQFGVGLMPGIDIVVFLTQDAILASPDSIARLLSAFDNPDVGAAYGRQLPRKKAGFIEEHSRVFNYPQTSRVNSLDDSRELGMKTAFISNSFAAYRCEVLQKIGGFPSKTIMSEDTYVAAKMLLSGWRIAYCADAVVYHSHDYSYLEEFRRYFDIGVFHSKEPWLRQKLGQAEGEGLRYVRSELKYLLIRNPLLIPSALLRTGLKLMGYRLGLKESKFSLKIKYFLSMHKGYWLN